MFAIVKHIYICALRIVVFLFVLHTSPPGFLWTVEVDSATIYVDSFYEIDRTLPACVNNITCHHTTHYEVGIYRPVPGLDFELIMMGF
ncbi:hypothetical protein BKA67DRAFT_571495 [Truncatella angustata]|uniref:Uncharacterized protein n=1 Tax=Truncatella angustata TaxID=152316 RepID=A0A9P8UGF2_9PEZI|nr:uncharacterized protein BKA67DRAFT_571495 [Truncatella angustata]KAH6651649.1 hypothetical protein BKA67DRAFT_571495 [Truncatella angustata]